MPVVYKRPRSLAARLSRKMGYIALVLLAVLWIGHRFAGLSTPNAVATGLVAAFIAFIGLGLSIIGLYMLWHVGARGGKASFVGLVLNLVALLPFGFATYRYVSLPQQYDVVTSEQSQLDWIRPPKPIRSWLPSESTGEVVFDLNNDRLYSQLAPRRYEGAVDRVYRAVILAARDRDFTIIATQGDEFLKNDEFTDDEATAQSNNEAEVSVPIPAPSPDASLDDLLVDQDPTFDELYIRIQFTNTSLLLGIDYDIMISMTEDEAATFLDMRAATPHGPHDLGLNVTLINKFLADVDNRLLGIAGIN